MKPQPAKAPEWTILKTLEWTTSHFQSNGIDSPRVTAEILLAHVLSLQRIDLYLRYDQPLSIAELTAFKALLRRRLGREPVAYIVGSKEFWSLELSVTPDVLIPRPDTECIVEAGLAWLPATEAERPSDVLELGTGSGAIILALASERPHSRYFATDVSRQAIKIAARNAASNGLADRVCFFVANWLDAIRRGAGRFDLIVANPPYIPTAVIETLEPEVRQFEPRQALDGGKDGCLALAHIMREAATMLRPGGGLLLEMGYDQGEQMMEIARGMGVYEDVSVRKDYGGNDRVVQMRRALR